jgi:integrase
MSGLSPATVAAYNSRIFQLQATIEGEHYRAAARNTGEFPEGADYDFHEMKWEDNLQLLKTHKRFANPETRKGYLSALLWKVDDKDSCAWAEYHKYFCELKQECMNKAKEQKLPANRQEKYLTKDQLIEAYQKCYSIWLEKKEDYYDHLVLALYIIQAPVRADYCGMRILDISDTNSVIQPELNYCCLSETKGESFFLFQKYKTAKTYGKVSIPIEPDLEAILQDHFYTRKNRDVLPDFWTSNTLSQKVRELTKKYSGKSCSIGLIRHAWVFDLYKTNPTIKEKEALARRMLHSVAVQELYRTTECLEVLNQDE